VIGTRKQRVQPPRNHDRVAGLLSDPHAIRMGGHARDMHPRGPYLHDKQHVQALEEDRVHIKQSQADRPSACMRRNARQEVSALRGAGLYRRQPTSRLAVEGTRTRARPGPVSGYEGQRVSEIDCSRHVGKRRPGKNDPIDAVRAARELLARLCLRRCEPTETARPPAAADDRPGQRHPLRTRPPAPAWPPPGHFSRPLRERGRPLPRERRAKECAQLACPPGVDRQTRVLHQTLIRLGQRIATLGAEAAEFEEHIAGMVEEMAPRPSPCQARTRRPCPPPRSCCPGHRSAGSTARQPQCKANSFIVRRILRYARADTCVSNALP
jgi:hypothetical protein